MQPHLKMGPYIKKRRKALGLTQQQLADKLNLSFQAVSKWETGESYPDVSVLTQLADILETTVDKLLHGGTVVIKPTQTMQVAHILEGLDALNNLKGALGRDSLIYQGAMEGINAKLNTDIEAALNDPAQKEVIVTELIIQGILSGQSVELNEVKETLKNPALIKLIMRYLGIPTQTLALDDQEDPALFVQIRRLNTHFDGVNVLKEMPGEFIALTPSKTYFATEVVVSENECYGIAVDESMIHVFKYGKNGAHHQKIEEVLIER